MERFLKLVIVGDGGVGKTTLLTRFDRGIFPCVTIIYESRVHDMMVDGVPAAVALWDTAGGEEYDRLRPLAYPDTDVFLLCFAVDRRDSFEACPGRFLPEVRHHCPDTPIILVGCKSDLVKIVPDSCISVEEIQRRAEEWGVPYIETSSLVPICVDDCFQMAVRAARCGWERQKSKKKGKMKRWRSPGATRAEITRSPPAFPSVIVDNSEFSAQWAVALENPEYDDVTFKLHFGREVRAHSLVLSAASAFFKDAVANLCTSKIPSSQGSSIHTHGISDKWENAERKRIYFQLEDTISENALVCVLHFLYTGVLSIPDDRVLREQINTLGHAWKIACLSLVCENIQNEEDSLNPSIRTYLNAEMCAQFKKMYLCSTQQADMFFQVEGHRIPAHRAILTARCPVLAAMLSRRFMEGSDDMADIVVRDVDYESFLALLEYIYTDTAPIEEGDAVAILAVADQFCQSRLVTLCELYIIQYTQKLLTTDAKRNAAYVIDLLNFAQRHNARQLAAWCLHALALNYAHVRRNLRKAHLSAEQVSCINELRQSLDNNELNAEKRCTMM